MFVYNFLQKIFDEKISDHDPLSVHATSMFLLSRVYSNTEYQNKKSSMASLLNAFWQ